MGDQTDAGSKKRRMSPVARVSSYLFRYWGLFATTLLFATIMTGLSVWVPQQVRMVINNVLGQEGVVEEGARSTAIEQLLIGVGIIFALYLGREVFNMLRIIVNNVLEQRVLIELRTELHDKLLDLPIGFFDNRKSGDVASTVIEDVNNLERALLDGTEQGLTAILTIVGISLIIVPDQPLLSAIVFLPVPLLAVMGFFHSKKARRLWRKVRDSAGNLNALLMEDIQGNRLIQSFGLKPRERGRFRDKAETLRSDTLRGMFNWATFSPRIGLVSQLGFLGVIAYGGYLLIARPEQFNPGDLIAFILYAGMVTDPIRTLTQLTQLLSTGNASGERVFDLLDHKVDITNAPESKPFPSEPVNVTFEEVRFAYNERRHAIPPVNLELPPGKVTALVGHTGAGKSTVANLIWRYYDVTEGRVAINGLDVREIDLAQLRLNIGVVAQDPFLFDASVRENLELARPDAPEAALIEALKGASAWDFVRNLPDGIDTLIGERGVRLSMGEKQRLTIARVMLKNPPLVILDEATSSVDTITERMIQRALDNLVRERTTLVIAHRLSTVRRADQIVVLDQGEILERGTHDDLCAKNGHYARLWQHQLDLIPEHA